MSSLNDSLLKGYEKYYNNLVDNGHIGTMHVNRLVIAGWINKVLNGKYGVTPTDEQYALLDKLYQCVEGDCLVPYQQYCSNAVVDKVDFGYYIRITEAESLTRLLENDNIRIL